MSTPKPWKRKLEILQGQTLDDLKTWKAGTTPTPVDLTGCTARMHVRERIDSPTTLLELTTENGGIELGGTAGTIRIRMSATATAALTWRTGVYDLEIEFPGGIVRRVLAGTVVVSPEVTR